jgi:hypothetical protein
MSTGHCRQQPPRVSQLSVYERAGTRDSVHSRTLASGRVPRRGGHWLALLLPVMAVVKDNETASSGQEFAAFASPDGCFIREPFAASARSYPREGGKSLGRGTAISRRIVLRGETADSTGQQSQATAVYVGTIGRFGYGLLGFRLPRFLV